MLPTPQLYFKDFKFLIANKYIIEKIANGSVNVFSAFSA
jgi:hypothetical protein